MAGLRQRFIRRAALLASAAAATSKLGDFKRTPEKRIKCRSAHGYHRVLKVARTIADLTGADTVTRVHVAEALSYRRVVHPSG
jgi:predicted ATPase with chaperone activity